MRGSVSVVSGGGEWGSVWMLNGWVGGGGSVWMLNVDGGAGSLWMVDVFWHEGKGCRLFCYVWNTERLCMCMEQRKRNCVWWENRDCV